MTEFVSDIKTIGHSEEDIFKVISDFSNLELLKDRIPEDKIKDFSFDSDSCSFNINPIGNIRFVITEREPSKLVKLKSENIPFELQVWIQLKEVGEKDTKMKITVKTELNPLIKPMVSKPIIEALDKLAETIAILPYDKL